jgi:hypothetical protein
MSAKLYEFVIEGGETDPETGRTVDCTATAARAMVIANDVTVMGGVTSNGTVIDPTIKNSVVTGGVRIGTDVVTEKAIVIGNIGYNGISTGGVLTDGIATGKINGKFYIIENGITTGGYSNKCTVEGGMIKGGTKIGDTIIGATIYGGNVECGVTYEGTTTLGEDGIIKSGTFSLPDNLIDNIGLKADDNVDAFEREINNLVLWWTSDAGGFHFGTNIGSTNA